MPTELGELFTSAPFANNGQQSDGAGVTGLPCLRSKIRFYSFGCAPRRAQDAEQACSLEALTVASRSCETDMMCAPRSDRAGQGTKIQGV